MSVLDETLREFLVESSENLDHLDRELMALEEDPNNNEAINRIFRIVHTLKGTCGFFNLSILEGVSHVAENLLDSMRDGKVVVTEEVITALLHLGDALRSMLVNVEQTGNEGSEAYSELKEVLGRLNQPTESATAAASATKKDTHETTPTLAPHLPSEEDELQRLFLATQEAYAKENEQIPSPSKGGAPVVEAAPSAPIQQKLEPTPVSGEELKKSDVSESTLRVDISLLDRLMNLVGELVLARNQILQFTKSNGEGEFLSASQRLNLITSELQEGVMRTRMQPIANVWNKLPRVVRDISHLCGKRVRLEMHGKETELDKTIIEAIKDPLTHIIRNAVDHGIESPEARQAAHKDPEGVLRMRAFHEGGQVIIEIGDDGGGLNVEKVKKKAVERGIVSAEKATRMSDQEAYRLIFLPGFSTAEKVTNISGRGVGMDVVRSNIERIGGTVDVTSQYQRGTTFTIKIPLTLAIIPALIVTAENHRYAIPQVNLLELVRVGGDQIAEKVEYINDAMFCRLRGKLLPLVRLRSELGLAPERAVEGGEEAVLNIVIVRADSHQFGLIVDNICDTEEIVVKPLGKLLKGVSAFAGATIMGDGRVALILDVVGLARQAHVAKKEASLREEATTVASEGAGSKSRLLIFDLNDRQRGAIPLDQVHRLEEFDPSTFEKAGGASVVQYRQGILPLIDLSHFLSGVPPNYEGPVRAFVHQFGDRFVGFVVKNIVDIVEQSVQTESPFKRRGLYGSAIIQGVVTDLVDLNSVLEHADGDSMGGGIWN